MPHVLSSGFRTFLVYLVHTPDPDWDGTDCKIVDTTDDNDLAVVEFKDCYAHRFGGPDEDLIPAHPLYQRGLTGYGAYLIENSAWVEQLKLLSSHQEEYGADFLSDTRHYFLHFHDEMFECLAGSHQIEVKKTDFATALKHATDQLWTDT